MKRKYHIPNHCFNYDLESKGDKLNFHCHNCNKNVRDLQSLDLPELIKTIDKEINTCVRISSNQLVTLNNIINKSKAVAFASMITFGATGCNKRIVSSYSGNESSISINEDKTDLQNYQIGGRIIESATNLPIIGAQILLENRELEFFSDVDGAFKISLPDSVEDSDTIKINYSGFDNIEIEVGKIRGKEIIVYMGYDETIIGYIEVIE